MEWCGDDGVCEDAYRKDEMGVDAVRRARKSNRADEEMELNSTGNHR